MQSATRHRINAQNPLARKPYLRKEDLLSQKFLLTEQGMSYRRLLDEWLARHSLEIRPVLETGRADPICHLVEQNVGISFLPDYVTDVYAERGSIVRLDVEGFQPDLWKQLLYHREKWISGAMQDVISLLTEALV